MKHLRIAVLALACASASGCSILAPLFQSNDQAETVSVRPVSKDYSSDQGDSPAVLAIVYGRRTVLEFKSASTSFVTIEDEFGDAVPFEREGRYYRLDQQLDRFAVVAMGRTYRFEAIQKTPTAKQWKSNAPKREEMAVTPKIAPETDRNAGLMLQLAELQQQIRELKESMQSMSNQNQLARSNIEPVITVPVAVVSAPRATTPQTRENAAPVAAHKAVAANQGKVPHTVPAVKPAQNKPATSLATINRNIDTVTAKVELVKVQVVGNNKFPAIVRK